MKVVTVTGNVDPEDLGVTMTHEHVRYIDPNNSEDFVDMSNFMYTGKPKNAK